MSHEAYVEQLQAVPAASEWLLARGLTPGTIAQARLGYVLEPVKAEHYHFRGWLVIPYFDARGRERLLRFRDLTQANPPNKYLPEKGKGAHLYGVELTMSDHVYVTEGEIDALILRQLGLAAVGVPGAKTWKREWCWLFRDCEHVSVVFDDDPAGVEGAEKIAVQLEHFVEHVDVVELPGGMDVNDLYLRDPQELGRLL